MADSYRGIGDTSATDDLLIDTSNANAVIRGLQFTGTWATNSKGTENVMINDTSASGRISGIHFAGNRTYIAGNNNGLDIKAGRNITIDNSQVCTLAAGSGTGIIIEGATSDVSVRGAQLDAVTTAPAVWQLVFR